MTSPIPTEGGKSWTWELHELSEGPSAIVYDEHGRMIADHLTPAIAAKIAAAPALLEALQAQEDQQRRGWLNMTVAEVERVKTLRRAALALATGGEDGR